MVIQFPGLQIIGQRSGQRLIVRQDSLRFADFNMQIVQQAGAPVGQYEEGSMFINAKDKKMYFVMNYKFAHTPDLLWLKCNAINSNLVQDYSTGQHVVTTATSATIVDAGAFKKAINFDATNDKLVIDNTLGMSVNTDWAVGFYAKIPVIPSNNADKAYIFERYVDATHWFRIYFEYLTPSSFTNLKVAYQDGGGVTIVTGSNNSQYKDAQIGTWVHFLLSHDTSDNRIHFYKDGGAQGLQVATIPNITFGTEDYEVGRSQVDSSFGDFVIQLDEIKIWDSERTGTDPKVDSLNLDTLHWVSFSGSVVD